MADFGYDVADFTGVDPVFGTEGELERMIAGTEAQS
jgi:alpha-glucosidase